MVWDPDPSRLEALDRMTQALKAAKAARDRGANLQPIRDAVDQARKAFGAHDYRRAIELANRALELCGFPQPTS